MPHIKLTDICPCLVSGKTFEKCCARYNSKPLYAVTRTPDPKTGIKNSGCYASAFSDCSTKISREHFLSEGILKILNENRSLTVAGFPWLKTGEHKNLHPSSLTGNVLCARHNSALSPLDKVAIRFFRALRQIEQEFADEQISTLERVFLFNGHDIEQWMLKTLCGLVCSKNAMNLDSESITDWLPPISWLNMLFGIQKFRTGCGIYFEANIGEKRPLYQGVNLAPLFDQNGNVTGIAVDLKEHSFILAMVQPPQELKGTILEHGVYRPKELVTRKLNEPAIKAIVLGWDSPSNGGTIEITLSLQ
jgi:hypothetical protein